MPDVEMAARWNQFVGQAPFATHYVTANYFIDPYIRGEAFAVLAADEGGEITAVLTGTIDGEKIVSGMFSRPQIVFGKNVNRESAASALLEGITEVSHSSKSLIEIYAWEELPQISVDGMQVRKSNDSTSVVILELADGPDAIFAKFSQTRRNEIRKAIKQNLVEIKQLETDTELDELYQIHCDWNERKGNQADTIEQIKTSVGQTENRRVFIAKANGKVIAGSFYRFCSGVVVEYAANVSMPQFQRLRPNDLIGWHAIHWACSENFTHFSMGGSHLFLRRFGGEIRQTFRYRRDQSRFKLHVLRENARKFTNSAYRRLPENFKNGVRKILAR